jgi:hypothetical protein
VLTRTELAAALARRARRRGRKRVDDLLAEAEADARRLAFVEELRFVEESRRIVQLARGVETIRALEDARVDRGRPRADVERPRGRIGLAHLLVR